MISGLLMMSAAALSCSPVPGADRLWRSETRWVVVGEVHGTAETPGAFVNLACLAAATRRPVTVALEYPAEWQATIDAFLASDGGINARAALLKLPVWHSSEPDGRGSVAFLRMFEALRRMKQAGTITGVVASDASDSARPPIPRDAMIAQAWTAIPARDDGIILALVGNFHAIRTGVGEPGHVMRPAASLLPAARTMTIKVEGDGGTTWDCEQDGCGIHGNGSRRHADAGITYSNDPTRRWDAVYELGTSTTASPPALVTSDSAAGEGRPH